MNFYVPYIVGSLIVALVTVVTQVFLFAYRWGGLQKQNELSQAQVAKLAEQITTLTKEVRRHEVLLNRIADQLCLKPGLTDHRGAN